MINKNFDTAKKFYEKNADFSKKSYTSKNILPGEYTRVTFRFGFSENNNIDGAYTDLNTADFNVPEFLGGGYHYMQFDGKYNIFQCFVLEIYLILMVLILILVILMEKPNEGTHKRRLTRSLHVQAKSISQEFPQSLLKAVF